MKKYFVMTEDGVAVYATKSMIKAIGWVLNNCKMIDSENDIFELPNGKRVFYKIAE